MEVKKVLDYSNKGFISKSHLLDKKVNRIIVRIKKHCDISANLEKKDKNLLEIKNEINKNKNSFLITQIKYLFNIINIINNERKRFREIIQKNFFKENKENLLKNKLEYFTKENIFKMHEDLKNSINSLKLGLDDFKKENKSIFLKRSPPQSSQKSKIKFKSFFDSLKDKKKLEKKTEIYFDLNKKKVETKTDKIFSKDKEISKILIALNKKENSSTEKICYKSLVEKRKIQKRTKKIISN